MAWKAYTDTQALKELAGLRGVAPSVRFLEKRPQGTNKEKIYHVRANSPMYLWGVEMFQGGYDCVTINMINANGTETLYKPGGIQIENFINKESFPHNLDLIEYPPFDDFWTDPYIINHISDKDETTNDGNVEVKKIIKSNFYRCFVFPTEGYYRITLNERINPLTGSTGFIANHTEPQYAPTNNMIARSYFFNVFQNATGNGDTTYDGLSSNEKSANTDMPIQAVRTECETKREIIIKVISDTKDIVTGNTINAGTGNRIVINCAPGVLNKQVGVVTPTTIDGIKTFGSVHVKGNNSFFTNRHLWEVPNNRAPFAVSSGVQSLQYDSFRPFFDLGFDTDPNRIDNDALEDLHLDPNMEYAPIQKEVYVGSQVNNGTISSSTVTQNGVPIPFSTSNNNNDGGLRKLKVINARNSIIEDLNIIGTDGSSRYASPTKRGPNSWNINSGNGVPARNRVRYAGIDLSGSVFRNCVIENDIFGSFGFKNDTYGIYDRYIIDGCTFENCTFRGNNTIANIVSGVGILFKNCKFERPPRAGSASVVTMYSTHSISFMGCTWHDLGRTLFLDPYGPITDNIVIRCSDSRKSNHYQAGEGITLDAPAEGGGQWQNANGFTGTERLTSDWCVNNLFLFNESRYSSGSGIVFSSFDSLSKLNLSAFCSSFYSPESYLKSTFTNRATDATKFSNAYNVYMHNYSFGLSEKMVDLRGPSNNNRFLNCVWDNIPGGANSFGSYAFVAATIYGAGSAISVRDEAIGVPESNLINNCSIVNYLETQYFPLPTWAVGSKLDELGGDYGFYGFQDATKPGFKYANPTTGSFFTNLTDTQLDTKLNNKENIINNLTKIGLRHT